MKRMNKTLIEKYLKIRWKEIIYVIAIIFFTILIGFVDISPFIEKTFKHNRTFQIIAVYFMSFSILVSDVGIDNIKFHIYLNALIVTLIFIVITKPKKEILQKIEDKVDEIKVKEEEKKITKSLN